MSLSSSIYVTASLQATMTGFPESFQRSTVSSQDTQEAAVSETSSTWTSVSEVNSLSFPQDPIPVPRGREYSSMPSPRRVSRSSVMRLENILNDVSINHVLPPPRSRSLGRSPVQPHLVLFEPSSPVSLPERSESPEETCVGAIKKKKVKMHRCPECQKDFPRPSGLRTHMNMHTKEKPFGCTFPGCLRTFSVVSNAKRHMRTHGLGVSAEDADQSSIPYVVGFEAPMVVDHPDVLGMQGETNRSHPFRLRWIPLASMPPKMSAISMSLSNAPAGNEAATAQVSQG